MKRDKEWWQNLSPQERSHLVQLERANCHNYGGGDYLPDGMSECGYCSNPHSGYGICPYCNNDLENLINKANDIRSINSNISHPVHTLGG